MKIKLLPSLLLVLTPFFVFSQTAENYQTTTSGLWDDVSSWQYFDMSFWITPLINSFQEYRDPYSVTAEAVLTAPLIGLIKPIDCSSAGSVALSGLPIGNWVINPGGIRGTGTNITITDLAVGSYSFTVTDESGFISPATTMGSVVITDKSCSIWTNSWSNGIPTINTTVILAGNYDMTANPNIAACSLTINTGVSLTITDGKFVAIQNNLTVNVGATLNITNQGSLVMVSDSGTVANSGIIKLNIAKSLIEKSDDTY